MNGKRVILVGATGMVGGYALRLCLDNDDVSRVTVIGRRGTGVDHVKLHEILHDNFIDYSEIANALKNQDVALYCLGAYTGAIPDDELRRITVDYTMAVAAALLRESPQVSFCFLSGRGADQTGQSRIAFARYKGAAEKALLELGFPRIHIFRPGYISPDTPRKEPNVLYRIMRALYPALRRIYPNIGISSEDLARAMVTAGLHGTNKNTNSILENKEIRQCNNC